MPIKDYVPTPYVPRVTQDEYFDWLSANYTTFDAAAVIAPTACHAPGTLIRMHNGETKKVEEIIVGDLVMGPNSLPRKVTKLFNGNGKMYKITPKRGNSFVVNDDHILSLKSTETGHRYERADRVVNISVKDYIKKSKNFKHIFKLYRTSVDYSYVNQKIPPYLLGIWLGDGHTDQIAITSMDEEILTFFRNYAQSQSMFVREQSKPNNKAKTLNLHQGYKGQTRNKVRDLFKYYNLLENKHIPKDYLIADRKQRLELLAGLLDTDGHLNNNAYDYITKLPILAKQIEELSRSLGFNCTVRSCKKQDQHGTSATYYRMCISGFGVETIPCKLPRKITKRSKKPQKDVLKVGFTTTYVGYGEYFGFEVDGDNLYLMGDFTVTHNCGKSLMNITAGRWIVGDLQGSVALMAPRKFLQDQITNEFGWIPTLKGMGAYTCNDCLIKGGTCRQRKQVVGKCCDDCVYLAARMAAQQARLALFNFHSYFINKMYKDVAIIDEGHGAIDLLYGLFGRKLWKCEVGYSDDIEATPEAVADLIRDIVENLENKLSEFTANRVADEMIQAIQDEIESFSMLRTALIDCGEDFLIKKKKDVYFGEVKELRKTEQEYIYVKTMRIDKLAEKVLWPRKEVKKVILTSATIGKEDIELLGLNNGRNVKYYECESLIPWESRMIVIDPVASMAYKNRLQSYPIIVAKIQEIVNNHKGQKGVVHCTYDVAKKLKEMLGEGGRFLYHTSNNKDQVLKQFMASKKDTVLVASGMAEGIDLKDDLARFQIITMLQFPSLEDDVMAWMANRYPMRYKWLCIRTFIQQCGRIVRHPSDYGVTYIIDSTMSKKFFKETEHLWPKWVKRAMVWTQ